MSSATAPKRSILDALPTEIIVLILAEADPSSVALFERCSHACREIVTTAEQVIYEGIAEKRFDPFTPCSAGDSGITRDALPHTLARYNQAVVEDKPHSTQDLNRAIRCLRSGASTAFDEVHSWRAYVQQRTILERTWKSGRPSRYVLSESSGGQNFGCWRFKVCSITGIVIKSSPSAGQWTPGIIKAYLPGHHVFDGERGYFVEMAPGYTHIEYSNGYLVYIDNNGIMVYVLDEEGTAGEKFKQLHDIWGDDRLSSYKLRFPYLISTSGTSNRVYIYDVQVGKLSRTYERLDGPHRSYVELDQWSLFLADDTVTVIDRAKGLQYNLLEPWAQGPIAELDSTSWTAVHHSLDGRHLIAVGDANELIWFRNYRTFLTDEAHIIDKQKRDANTVVLRLQEPAGEIHLDNLAVENDRVVFTTRTSTFPVVYFFELSGWENLSIFKHNTPLIRVLSGGVPTGLDGISRIEMDSACIYLTCSTNPGFERIPGFQDIHPEDLEITWCTLDGTELCNATVRPVWPAASPATKHNMQEVVSYIRMVNNEGMISNNEILCYDFGRPEAEETVDSISTDTSAAMFAVEEE